MSGDKGHISRTGTVTNRNEVGPTYFRTLGTPLLAGHAFDDRDTIDASRVVIVNEAYAEEFGLGRTAVGARMGRDWTRFEPRHDRKVSLTCQHRDDP